MMDSPVTIPKDFPLLLLCTTPIGSSLKDFLIFSYAMCVYWTHLALFNLPGVELADGGGIVCSGALVLLMSQRNWIT